MIASSDISPRCTLPQVVRGSTITVAGITVPGTDCSSSETRSRVSSAIRVGKIHTGLARKPSAAPPSWRSSTWFALDSPIATKITS